MYTLEPAPDVMGMIEEILPYVPFGHIDPKRLYTMRSFGAVARARARIWSFPKIWQMALGVEACYVIEVLSHHFDHLTPDDKTRVVIHELMHIPKTFSGALAPHRGRYHKINHRTVETYFRMYKNQEVPMVLEKQKKKKRNLQEDPLYKQMVRGILRLTNS